MIGFGQAPPQSGNPFVQLAPLPAGSTGGRGFRTPVAAREAAGNTGAKTFAIIKAGQEFAWISPLAAFTARAMPALLAGVVLVDMQQ